MLDALIIGGDSQIGKALIEKLHREGRPSVSTTRKWPPAVGMLPFDLRWPSFLPQAKVTFFCTGINGFKPCAIDPDEARKINVTLTTSVAKRVYGGASHPVFLSSSAAETHPDTVYGKCKLDAEKVFLQLGGACYRFGPVAFPGRNVYPNETYSPMNLSTLTGILARCLTHWKPGLHCLYNRDWTPEECPMAKSA